MQKINAFAALAFCTDFNLSKVRSLLEHSCAILSSFKIVVIFNIISADFLMVSVDVVLKMTTILKEMRIVQLSSQNEWTLIINLKEEKTLDTSHFSKTR